MPTTGPVNDTPELQAGEVQRLAEVVQFPSPDGKEAASPDLSDMTSLAATLRRSTGASGVAIATVNAEGAIVCAASAGHAPGPGTLVNPSHGLAGECVRTRKLQVCLDTENDARVDVDVCRAANICSAAVVPSCDDDRLLGVISAYSNQRNHFQGEQVQALQQAAEALAQHMRASEAPGIERNSAALTTGAPPADSASAASSAGAAFSLSEAADAVPGFEFTFEAGEQWEQAQQARRRGLMWAAALIVALMVLVGAPLIASLFRSPDYRVNSPAEPRYGEPPTVETAKRQAPQPANGGPAAVFPIAYQAEMKQSRITVPLSRYVGFRSGTLKNPERIFVDMTNTRLVGGDAKNENRVDVGDEVVRSVRMSQNNNNVTRVVVDLNRKAKVQAAYAADPPRIEITVSSAK